MDIRPTWIGSAIAVVAILTWAWRVLNWVWLRPKKLERCLRQQGLTGNSYRLLFGDLRENSKMLRDAKRKPINLSDDIVPRVIPFAHPSIKNYGMPLMLPAFYMSCSQMIIKWESLVPCELDVWPCLKDMTSDVISRTAFGSSYEEAGRIFHLLTEQASLTAQVMQSIYIPGWRFLLTKINKRMKEINKEIQVSLNAIINKREKATKEGEAANDDLLGLLLESNCKEINEHGNHKNVGMSIREVIEECKLFYFAGQETTAVLLVWTMLLLSKHQEWQALAQEEVLQVFGNDKPNMDGLNHLKIVTMILYEVLRLYPLVAVLNRAVYEETKLGELSLLAGVELSLPTILVQNDHELWGEDAKEFKPEKFSNGVSKATKSQFSFFPFGWGPRICIGQNFAMIEAKMALAMILQRFSFELSPSYGHAPNLVFNLKPQYGAHITLHKLK